MEETAKGTNSVAAQKNEGDKISENQKRGCNCKLWIGLILLVLFLTTAGMYLVGAIKPAKVILPPSPNPPIRPTASNQTVYWKTYNSTENSFEFKYPPDWEIDVFNSVIYILDEQSQKIIMIDPNTDLSVIGVSACQISPEDSDCETLEIDGKIIQIDWGQNEQESSGAFFIKRASAGVNFVLLKSTDTNKTIFRQMLLTFKFLDTTDSSTYSCPTTEYVDCMPGPGAVRPYCDQGFLSWAQENCPNFKGAAY